jgi:hypothetical protein
VSIRRNGPKRKKVKTMIGVRREREWKGGVGKDGQDGRRRVTYRKEERCADAGDGGYVERE